ncbi:MAG: guanylate kinase [Candidatus Melainabacteria bacterium RIFOXYA12_FULL_32_12]|nr:MAG: guanylate kinase [Candidatus Melainabacteria bacterium RIFOXYA2_FULL_32_9]OGI31047.1 MAG: guanylate kinase [Candidatus Melainabacteria bacterium RIFOXYA12_FULL_32_12]
MLDLDNLESIDFSILANVNRKGRVFIISGPSGVGKGTLLSLLIGKHPEIVLSVSVTTRKPRTGEVHGVNYIFISKEEFEEMIEKDEFLEWAVFAGNYYGTYANIVQESLNMGLDVALEIDVKGALQVKEKLKDAILIFILPPSIAELQTRLFKRKTDSQESIQKRLSIVKSEIEKKHLFDYEIVNQDLDTAIKNLEAIVLAERCRIRNGQN